MNSTTYVTCNQCEKVTEFRVLTGKYKNARYRFARCEHCGYESIIWAEDAKIRQLRNRQRNLRKPDPKITDELLRLTDDLIEEIKEHDVRI